MSLRSVLLVALSIIGFVPGAVAAATAPPQTDLCTLVSDRFPGKVGAGYSDIYQTSQTSYFSALERGVTPRCVFRPTAVHEVADFVTLARQHDACRQCSLDRPLFAVRGGGHTIWAGAANAAGGVTVDMRSLAAVTLNSARNVSVGAGANFVEVYPQLVPHNLTVVGARVPGVAAGGFLTGGGKSFLSRRHGFGADNILGYEVVLASGKIVYASENENPDLWLALKGGSNNFGIVTRYDLAAYPLGRMWGGTQSLNFTPAVLRQQAQAFHDFMLPQNLDDAADVGVLIGYDRGAYFLADTMYYSADRANPPVFANFSRIPGVTARDLNLTSIAERVRLNGAVAPVRIDRSFELVYSFKNAAADEYNQMFTILTDGMKGVLNITGLQMQYLLQPMPVTAGKNSFGLPVNDTDLAMAVFTCSWKNIGDDNTMNRVMQQIVQRQEAVLQKAGRMIDFRYLNYADVSQNPIQSYGPKSVASLWAASTKYDPHGFWQTRVPGYKLPKRS